MNLKNTTFTATCAAGLELLLVEELQSLGATSVSETKGAVSFNGSLETAYKACLWSRVAARILLPLANFSSPDTDTLYNQCQKIYWHEHLLPNGTFAVDCAVSDSKINHSKFAALRVKDAVVDQLRKKFKQRPSIDIKRPDIRINLYIKDDNAFLSLDLSGTGLHQRGYRAEAGEAPLKETLAAAIAMFSGWNKNIDPEDVLLDPMCGSGTILIEAGCIYGDIAPGLKRDYFGFLGWLGHKKELWNKIISEAQERKKTGLSKPWPKIIGYDADNKLLQFADENIERAGLKSVIHLERRELAILSNPISQKQYLNGGTGIMLTNPPYGERLGTINDTRYLFKFFNKRLKEQFTGWKVGILMGNSELTNFINIPVSNSHRLFNGSIPCKLLFYNISNVPIDNSQSEQPGPTGSNINKDNAFANRLLKNYRNLSKWLKKERISCYRLYDADIPEYTYELFCDPKTGRRPDNL